MSSLQFLAPAALVGLLAIPLIVFLHLRQSTPTVRPVPSIKFWKQTDPQITETPRLRFPPLSVSLLLQLLAATALVLALSRPAWSGAVESLGNAAGSKHLIVLVDGSTSMLATDTTSGSTRYEEAIEQASDDIGKLQAGDVATVLLLGAHPSTLQASDIASFDRLQEDLADSEPSGGHMDLGGALSLASALLLPELSDQIVLYSDGATSVDPAVVAEVAAPIEFHEIGQPASANTAIVSFGSKANPTDPLVTDFLARIANFSDLDKTVAWQLTADGRSIASGQLAVPAEDGADLPVSISVGNASRVSLQITPDDALLADNQAELIVDRQDRQSVAIELVSDSPAILQRSLTSIPGVTVTSVSTSEYLQGTAPVQQFDIVAFDGIAPSAGAWPTTPTLLVNTPIGSAPASTQIMPEPTATHQRTGDPLLKGVDLTGVTFGETPIHQLQSGAIEVAGDNQGPLLYTIDQTPGGEPAVVLTFDLAASNIWQRVAFPILTTNIVHELAIPPVPSVVDAGEAVTLSTMPDTTEVIFAAPDGVETTSQVTQLAASTSTGSGTVSFSSTGQPGEYQITEKNGNGETQASYAFVVHAGDPVESRLSTSPELPSLLTGTSADLSASAGSSLSDLWPLLVIIGLLAICAEGLYLLFGRRLHLQRLAWR